MTKYGDLYEIVNPSLDLVSLCVITGEECATGLVCLSKRDNISRFFSYASRLTYGVSIQFLETIPLFFNDLRSDFILVRSLQNFHR